MQYIATLDLWAPGIQSAIERGQIKLQRGQWLQCGGSAPKKCRFIGVRGSGSIWVTHWQGSGRATVEKFITAADAFTGRATR